MMEMSFLEGLGPFLMIAPPWLSLASDNALRCSSLSRLGVPCASLPRHALPSATFPLHFALPCACGGGRTSHLLAAICGLGIRLAKGQSLKLSFV